MELLDKPPCDPFIMGEKPFVFMSLEGGYDVRIRLVPDCAPITVAYFLSLVNSGFYDGLTFHRLVAGFMIQGGDPNGTGDGETEFYVKGEFAENGVDNPLSHTLGTLALARQEGCDTASCQFFITLADAPALDGHYAAFGRVVGGMQAILRLAQTPVDADARPVAPLVIKRIYPERPFA